MIKVDGEKVLVMSIDGDTLYELTFEEFKDISDFVEKEKARIHAEKYGKIEKEIEELKESVKQSKKRMDKDYHYFMQWPPEPNRTQDLVTTCKLLHEESVKLKCLKLELQDMK